MFRITCFADDKQLAAVLHALAGITRGQPEIVPVANATVEKGEVKAKLNGTLVELFAQYMDTHPGEIDANYARAFQKSIGRSPDGYSNVLQKAQHAKLLKKGKRNGGTGGPYTYLRANK